MTEQPGRAKPAGTETGMASGSHEELGKICNAISGIGPRTYETPVAGGRGEVEHLVLPFGDDDDPPRRWLADSDFDDAVIAGDILRPDSCQPAPIKARTEPEREQGARCAPSGRCRLVQGVVF